MGILGEFSNLRSELFKEAQEDFPNARAEEGSIVLRHFGLKAGEKVLEFGAGDGLYTIEMAKRVTPGGEIIATDPSSEQLEGIHEKLLESRNLIKNSDLVIRTVQTDAENFANFGENEGKFDAIWSACSFHHVGDKTKAFADFSKLLKPGGRIGIFDVFTGSPLAKYFDLEVAKWSCTGHEVSFLSIEFADSLCYLNGFERPIIKEIVVPYKFEAEEDIGQFLYKYQAMIHGSPQKCLEAAKKILGIEKRLDGFYYLNFHNSLLIAYKK